MFAFDDLLSAIVAGSLMVKPKLLGRLRGGGGGTMNAGELGADIDLGLGRADPQPASAVCGRLNGVEGGGTLSERFLVFLGFLLGESDLELYSGPRPGDGGTLL